MFLKHFLIQRLSDSHNNTFFFPPVRQSGYNYYRPYIDQHFIPPPSSLTGMGEMCMLGFEPVLLRSFNRGREGEGGEVGAVR